jgi:hypothetical protein
MSLRPGARLEPCEIINARIARECHRDLVSPNRFLQELQTIVCGSSVSLLESARTPD